MITPWYIGNTTVRNPYRLKDGLTAIANSHVEGQSLRGREGDRLLNRLLGQAGIVKFRSDMPDSTESAGRKWRAAFNRLGFIYPDVSRVSGITQEELGVVDGITPNGYRLVEAKSVSDEQECFLRALSGQTLTVKLADKTKFNFNPLNHVIGIMQKVDEATGSTALSSLELALYVYATSPDDDYGDLVFRILDLRERRSRADYKNRFDKTELEVQAKDRGMSKPDRFKEYLDTNNRYLRATGMFLSKGRGLSLVPEKQSVAYELIAMPRSAWGSPQSIIDQCSGVDLPTDNLSVAYKVLREEVNCLRSYGVDFDLTGLDSSNVANVEQKRHEAEALLEKAKEEEYAHNQKNEWLEISIYLDMLANRRYTHSLSDDKDDEQELVIPQGEAPAYMEWTFWRAFLAMNSLLSKPYEVRRFKIDQDFFPLSTAPGRGSDLIVELEDCVIAVEVTLTENSRQEAAEGEPVRRHVADLAQGYPDKPVYGLFIANKIDSNTAETFRIGSWYDQNDNRSNLVIIPLTTSAFATLFKAIFKLQNPNPQLVTKVIQESYKIRNLFEGPSWKREINKIVNKEVSLLQA